MYEMLRVHPQIFMPDVKEPHFFSRFPEEDPPANRRVPTTLEQYLALFEPAGPGQRRGEASTTYLHAPLAAGRIAELWPDARVIAILREPASFVRSLHLQLLQSGVETEPDLRSALELEERRRAELSRGRRSLWRHALLYGEHVRYAEQLRRYHQRFAPEQVLVLLYEEFRSDNEGMVGEVLRFIGVQHPFEVQPTHANPTVTVRPSRAGELVQAVAAGRGPIAREAKAAVKLVVPRRLRRDAVQTLTRTLVHRKPPPEDPALAAELRQRFRDEVLAAGEYLGRDLAGVWGYEPARGA